MRMLIAIPTMGRKGKLIKCLNSLENAVSNMTDDVDVRVQLSFSVKEEYEFFYREYHDVNWISGSYINGEFRAPLFWNFVLQEMEEDILCYLSDDVILYKDALAVAYSTMNTRFPDTDGLLGFDVVNKPPDKLGKATYGMIGRMFAERFPDKHAFCPEYIKYFCDVELEDFAELSGKFYHCTEAKLTHLHPMTSEFDTSVARTRMVKDGAMYKTRKTFGLLWGKDFFIKGGKQEYVDRGIDGQLGA